MLGEPLVTTALVGLAIVVFWWLAPRCPECGSLLSIRDSLDPSLRHCRRCMSIFRKESRR
ncbi:MAG TPA: hypothetical protein VIC57_14535 [Candidatus Dormibacteraeota bacterium]|jgi:hypothetical protein